jgi:hypothetical protein
MQSPEETQSTTTDQLEKPETEGPAVDAQPIEPPQGIMAGVPGVQTFTINGI